MLAPECDPVGRIWQIAHLTKCAACLIKCAHLTNWHTSATFRRGKVQGWIRVRVTVWVGVSVRVRVMVRALIKGAFARHAAQLVKCAD